ncbi:unnamed protein product, partial [Allacma fusca]
LNKITTLQDFQFCRNLTELYVRRNEIRDLCELCYLQDLPKLRRLLLSENPAVDTAGSLYRATVLRCLPNLEVLDNQAVSADEVDAAMKSGLILEHPLQRRERAASPEPTYYDRESPPPPVVHNNRRSISQYDYEDDPPPPYRQNHGQTHSPDYQYQNGGNKSPDAGITPVTNGIPRHTNTAAVPPEEPRSQSPTTSPGTVPSRRQSGSPVMDYTNYYQTRDRETNGSRRQSVDYSGEALRNYDNYYEENHRPTQVISNQRHPPIPPSQMRAKPRTKTSNLLSAVLCLLPELDWSSLEVIEMAVRRRMDEIINN